jgi:manganese oxidase
MFKSFEFARRGLLGLAAMTVASGAFMQSADAATREYWIKAEEIVWDYAPSYPVNRMMGMEFGDAENVFLGEGPDRIGRKYVKSVYRSYAKDFAQVIDGPNGVDQPVIRQPGSPEEHLGVLGPILRANVGDRIVVKFKNETQFPASMHPHGVRYNKASEGAPYNDGTAEGPASGAIPPGGTWTYTWEVPERAGPGPNDPSSIAWLYHSHANETADTNAGLVGVIVVSARNSDGPRPQREFVTLLSVMNENASNYLDVNMAELSVADKEALKADGDFEESNLMHSINGLMYNNLRGLTMAKGERARWYVVALGTEVDLHTPHWHGVTLLHNGNRVDVTELMPASHKTLDLLADNAGNWLYHCHVNDHMDGGMSALFTITPAPAISEMVSP